MAAERAGAGGGARGGSSFRGLPDVRQVPVHRSVALALREAILSGRLPGGTRLVQAELARQLGTSNTPVREAMRELAVEGLIQLDSYRGAVVHAPELTEIRESYEIALLLEPAVARKAADSREPRALERLHALQERMTGVEDPLEYAQLNRELHRAIHALAAAPKLAELVGGLHDRTTLQMAVCMRRGVRGARESDAEHALILDAIERRDGDAAAARMREHLERTYDGICALIAAERAG